MSKFDKLDKIYKMIPEIECKGLCTDSCHNIPASKSERSRARARIGTDPFTNPKAIIAGKSMECRALKNGRCSIHNIRPAICRLYGVAEGLKCTFGCTPKKHLNDTIANMVIRSVESL